MKNNDGQPPIKTMDDYIALQSEKNQIALEHIREIVRRVVPQAEEGISYQIPMFRYKGMISNITGVSIVEIEKVITDFKAKI